MNNLKQAVRTKFGGEIWYTGFKNPSFIKKTKRTLKLCTKGNNKVNLSPAIENLLSPVQVSSLVNQKIKSKTECNCILKNIVDSIFKKYYISRLYNITHINPEYNAERHAQMQEVNSKLFALLTH